MSYPDFAELDKIFKEARECHRCYGGKSIYVPGFDRNNGGSGSAVMFINERPGRIGTGNSGVVSFDNDDPSANFFKEMFGSIGINRRDIFITNAVLCHPNFEGYRDTKPNTKEMKNCLYFLARQIEIVNPKIIVTIGGSAVKSLKYLYNQNSELRDFKLKNNIGQAIVEGRIIIYPLYHTSRLGRANRSEDEQYQDWQQLEQIYNNGIAPR